MNAEDYERLAALHRESAALYTEMAEMAAVKRSMRVVWYDKNRLTAAQASRIEAGDTTVWEELPPDVAGTVRWPPDGD